MSKTENSYWNEKEAVCMWQKKCHTQLFPLVLKMSHKVCGRYPHKYFQCEYTAHEIATDAYMLLYRFDPDKGRMFSYLSRCMFNALNNRRRQYHYRKNEPFSKNNDPEIGFCLQTECEINMVNVKDKIFEIISGSNLNFFEKEAMLDNIQYITQDDLSLSDEDLREKLLR